MNRLRIPAEQFAYIEVDFDGTPEEAVEEYRRITKLVKGGAGVDSKEWNRILDGYLTKKTMLADDYGALSLPQQAIIQEIKRSIARTSK
jgi:hypothetical protein